MDTLILSSEEIHTEILQLAVRYSALDGKQRSSEEEAEYQAVLDRTRVLQKMCTHPQKPGVTSVKETGWTGVCRICHKSFY